MITLTAWSSLTNPEGASQEVSHEDLLAWIQKPKVAASKATLPGFSLARFADDQRALRNVVTVSAVVLDDDSGTVDVAETARRWAEFAGCVHSTYSSTAEAPRSRVLLWTSRDMTAAEYAVVWAHVYALAAERGIGLDEAPKDPSRFWFVPAVRPDGVFACTELTGEPLDVDAILASSPATAPEEPRRVSADTRREYEGDVSGAERHRRRGLYAEYLSTAPPCVAGQGGDLQLFKVVQRGAYDLALPADDVLELVRDVYDPRCVPPWADELDARVTHKANDAKTTSTRPAMPPLPADLAHLARRGEKSGTVPENVAQTAPTAEKPVWPTAAERAARVGSRSLVRLKTGFHTVDAATRGGILQRKVVFVGGAPGAGKTALLVQLAYRWLVDGVHVGFLAADEDADSILVRFGQLAGLCRDALENGDPDERAKLVAWCQSVPLMLVDGDDEHATVEDVSIGLRDAAAGQPTGFFVDSVQTVRTKDAPPRGADVRAKINVAVRTLKHAAKVDGHVVVATSELARSAYRNKDQAENANPLASFKESGDLEYGAGLALVLVSRQGSAELVDATVVKNRLGQGKPAFLLKLDHVRAAVDETTMADSQAADDLYFIKDEVRGAIDAAHGKALSKSAIYARIGGRKNRVWRAVDELADAKALIEDRRGGYRFPLPGDAGYGSNVKL